jgi:hypothetical protein
MGFVIGVFSDTPHKWSTRFIDRYLGVSSNPLSRWLRSHLLCVTDTRYNKDTGLCKQYVINRTGVRYLRDLLGSNKQTYSEWTVLDEHRKKASIASLISGDSLTPSSSNTNTPCTTPSVLHLQVDDYSLVKSWAESEFADELDSLEFTYQDKSSRLWHPLQNVRSQYRKNIFSAAGMPWEYDIQCSAPTLIHQYSHRCGMDLYLFALRKYLNNRHLVREQVAQDVGITESQSKAVINALFAGARIGVSDQLDVYHMVNCDADVIQKLRDHKYIQELRADIKTCWDHIYPVVGRRTQTRNGVTRQVPMSSSHKWRVYFDLERVVMSSIRKYLDMTGNRYFLEHDGWRCVSQIDVSHLLNYVEYDTGYQILLEEKCLSTPVRSQWVFGLATARQ